MTAAPGPSLHDNAKLALELLRWSGDRTCVPSLAAGLDALDWLANRKIDSLYLLATGKPAARQSLYDKVWNLQRREAERVLAAIASAGLRPLVFKGAEMLSRFYASHGLNLLADIDVMLARAEISRVKPVMFGLGYRQAIFDTELGAPVDRDIEDIAAIEGAHYELAPFSTLLPLSLNDDELEEARTLAPHPIWKIDGNEAFVAVDIDLHHAVATDLESAPFFERAVRSSFSGALTFCDADHAWFMATRLYNEVAIHGKTSLRDFAYLAPLLAAGNVDWEIVLAAAHEYELYPSLYYYLGFLNHLQPGAVPDNVLSALNPLGTERMRDWGWQLEKLLDVLPAMPVG